MLKTIALTLLAGASMASLADKEWKATLSPRDGSGIEGSAKVEAKGADTTRLAVTIEKGAPGAAYDWHMHKGSCAADGAVVGAATAYPMLRTDSAGKGSSDVVLQVAAPVSGEYSIHVHTPRADSAAPMGKTAACGDLKED